jgi:hypothetical protein
MPPARRDFPSSAPRPASYTIWGDSPLPYFARARGGKSSSSSFTHPGAPLDLQPNPVSASPAFRRSARARISRRNCRQTRLPALNFSDACRLFFAELYQFHSIHLLQQLLSRAIPR